MRQEVAASYRPVVQKALETQSIDIDPDTKSLLRMPVLLPVYYIRSGNVCAAVNGQTGKFYLWAYGTGGSSSNSNFRGFNPSSSYSSQRPYITLTYDTSRARIYTDGEWKTAVPYVYKNGLWQPAAIKLCDNGSWD